MERNKLFNNDKTETQSETPSPLGLNKQCPHCKEYIPSAAKKCSHCGSDLRSPSARHPFLTSLLFIVTLAVVGDVLNAIVQQGSGTTQSTQTANITPAPAPTPASPPSICDTSLATLKQQAKKVDYKQLAKDPTSFDGTVATFTGQIAQIQQSGNDGFLRLAVTKTSYGWDVNDVLYVTYHHDSPAVDNDVVTVTGRLTGSQTYTSQANYQITIPSMDVCAVGFAVTQTPVPAALPAKKASPPAPASPQPAPAPAATPALPPTPTATWHTAFSFNNSSQTKTTSFPLQGSQQKITYTCSITDNSNSYGGNFNGIIQSTTGEHSDVFASVVACPKSDSTYEYTLSPGQYYLDLFGSNSSYTVTVEDYY